MVRLALLPWPLVAAFAAFCLTTSGYGQPLKSGVLTLVVPFAAGGPSDVAGRILAQGLTDVLGQNVVVENPVGAGGTVGSLRVSRGAPDGGQFVLGNNGTHSWSQSLYRNPPYDAVTDFTPLGLAVESPRVIIVPKNLPANTLPEFVAYVKANQAKIQFASAGAGSASHVSCILLNAMLGVTVTHVPYRGLGPAMQDLITGRVQYICDSVSTSKPQIEGNHVKGIATTGLKRSPALPDIATAKEQGLDFDVLTWQGLFLAKNTPAPIVNQLSLMLSRALDLPTVRDRLGPLGEEVPAPERRSPDYFKQFVASEIARWSGPIKASGVTVE
ncbi:MAG: tripartite tricarboxylate transporter substrate binding protein BugD [Xanthobacteraceae bacterium]|nr:tripartite tricarboxylate transporter substrate binding protein BugD [Xanthobacteraceae bacterium]